LAIASTELFLVLHLNPAQDLVPNKKFQTKQKIAKQIQQHFLISFFVLKKIFSL